MEKVEIIKLSIYLFIPVISGWIGWLTNYIAIKSLFKPINETNILGFKVQGLIPKRREIITKNISKIISKYFISNKDIFLNPNNENIEKLKWIILPKLKTKIENSIPIMIKSMTMGFISNIIEKEGDNFIKELVLGINEYIDKNMDVEFLIYKKLKNYNIENLEKIINNIAKQEFKHIELLGALIGFIIGIFQIIIIVFLN